MGDRPTFMLEDRLNFGINLYKAGASDVYINELETMAESIMMK